MTETKRTKQETVLVTGGSGFIGAHCILQLLEAGYRVRTTVRSLAREADVRAMLKTGGAEPGAALVFFAADLNSDAGWAEAVAGCDYVLHVASPFPSAQPKDENELIAPARDGALRVLRAARDAGVQRVVLTSSFAAVAYGHPQTDRPFTEEDWTDLSADLTAYVKSKTLAERAAWDFIAKEGGTLELCVINPVGVVGPVLGSDYSSSIELMARLMNGGVPRAPRVSYNFVDVRDVADGLITSAEKGKPGESYILSGQRITVRYMLETVREVTGKNFFQLKIPFDLAKFAAMFTPMYYEAAQATPRFTPYSLEVLKSNSNISHAKASRELGYQPRALYESIRDTVKWFLEKNN